MTIRRLHPEGRLTGAVVHGKVVYLAGQVADDPSLDAEGQTEDVLRQIDALLAEAGTDKSSLLSCQIFLADIRDISAMNQAWDRWLDAGNPRPASPWRQDCSTHAGKWRSRRSPRCPERRRIRRRIRTRGGFEPKYRHAESSETSLSPRSVHGLVRTKRSW